VITSGTDFSIYLLLPVRLVLVLVLFSTYFLSPYDHQQRRRRHRLDNPIVVQANTLQLASGVARIWREGGTHGRSLVFGFGG